MPPIRDRERATYQAIWDIDAYGEHSPGEQAVDLFMQMAKPKPGAWVLDAGCGSGKGSLALKERGLLVDQIDLIDARCQEARVFAFKAVCLWDNWTSDADYVYCCDVMEHIPPEFTMLVARRLLDAGRKGAFFHISLVPDQFGAFVGKPLHQSVYPFTWWRDRLAELGTVVECRDLITSGAYWVTR